MEDWNDGGPTCHLVNCGLTHYDFNRVVAYKGTNVRNSMQPTEFNLLRAQRSTLNPNKVEIEFETKLRTLTHLSVSPTDGMSYNSRNSTIYTRASYQNGRSHYISRIAFGRQLNETQKFMVVLEVKKFKTYLYRRKFKLQYLFYNFLGYSHKL